MSDPIPPMDQRRLADPAYRAELLGKVEALISVLELARRKVHRNMQVPGSDTDRLRKILLNLGNTLRICRRAQLTLIRASLLDEGPPTEEAAGKAGMSRREYLELGSLREYHRLRRLGPISADELDAVDLEDLCRQLVEGIDNAA